MPNHICTTCGTQYPASQEPPSHCPICEDERQYIGWNGQTWTTLEALCADHHNVLKTIEPGLIEIGTEPKFAIGQQAFLVQAPGGNVLWDCISLIDDPTLAVIKSLGGISAIAISHPHFYSSMVEWSRRFGSVPIYLHESNRDYVMRPDPVIVFWGGETQSVGDGLTLIRCGGHFPGSTVLHWATGAERRGVLLTADTINVVSDRRYVSFMHSFPNLIPLPASKVKGVALAVEPFRFDRIYGGWPGSIVTSDAKATVTRSAERYIRAIEGRGS
jgi:hypothetical protein